MAEEGKDKQLEGSKLDSALHSNFYAIDEMVSIARTKNKFKIEALFYNILPTFYMVSMDSEVFIEPYHLGYEKGEGKDSTMGGIVPLLRFSSKSPMYKFAQSHFWYIWNHENGDPTGNGAQPHNGYIQIKTMEEVRAEINRRKQGKTDRRRKNVPVATERRLSNRRGVPAPAI